MIHNYEPVSEAPHDAVYPFDLLRFSILPQLNYWMDGVPGKRTLFLSDEREAVVISFEENMRCMDLSPAASAIRHEYRSGRRYLHQARADASARPSAGNCAFFHMEITGETGRTYTLPGQMLVRTGHPWADGAEPVLIRILNSISLDEASVHTRI